VLTAATTRIAAAELWPTVAFVGATDVEAITTFARRSTRAAADAEATEETVATALLRTRFTPNTLE
jgi:hypothetical protein